MKRVSLFIVLLFSITLLVLPQRKKYRKAKQKEAITKIVFETFTKRERAEASITKDSAISIGSTETKFIVMDNAELYGLLSAVKAIQLSTIPLLVYPTKQRQVDGAAHCRITVSTTSATYQSQYFDSGKPMKQLEALYNVIGTIGNHIDENGSAYSP